MNRRYTNVPDELRHTIKLFEDHLVHGSMTTALMIGLTCAFLGQLVQPGILGALLSEHGRTTERIPVGTRALGDFANSVRMEEAAFISAFKRWAGVTPKRYRSR